MAPILDFLTEFLNHEGSPLTDGETVRRYIEERANDELPEWDVLLASVGERSGTKTDETLGRPIRCQQRKAGKKSDAKTLLVSNRHRVSSRGIEKTGLSPKLRCLAERNFREELKRNGKLTEGSPIHYPDRIYRELRTKPLLMIHLIDIKTGAPSASLDQPVLAWGISFPATNKEEKRVEYVVNTTWLRENYREDVEEDEMQGDDD